MDYTLIFFLWNPIKYKSSFENQCCSTQLILGMSRFLATQVLTQHPRFKSGNIPVADKVYIHVSNQSIGWKTWPPVGLSIQDCMLSLLLCGNHTESHSAVY